MADNKTASVKTDETKTENLPDTTKEAVAPSPLHTDHGSTLIADLSVVIDYGYSVVEVANKLRETIIDAVEYGTGLEVVEVNVQVTDVYIQGDDEDDEDQQTQVVPQHKNTELS